MTVATRSICSRVILPDPRSISPEMLNDLGTDARKEMKDHFGGVTQDQARRIRDILREVNDPPPKTGQTSFERVLKDDGDDPV